MRTSKMSTFYFFFTSLLALAFGFGCANKIIIQSEPPQAEVFVKVEGKKDKVSLGTTPLETTEAVIADKLNLTADSTQWIQ
jgi:hypothetical protein